MLSAREDGARSNLIFVSRKQLDRNREIYEALGRGEVHIAFRSGKLRFSPHLYNTNEDIDRALSILDETS